MRQETLFETTGGTGAYGQPLAPEPDPIPLNPTVAPADVPRLSDQHHKLLDLLRASPRTGPELSVLVGLRYGARIMELRQVGYVITKQNQGGGVWLYALASEPSH